MKTNQIDTFFNWFNELPYKYRMELATQVCEALPNLSLNPYHVKFLEQWQNHFSQFKDDDSKQKEVMQSLKDTIEKVIASKKESLINWATEKAAIDEAAQLTGSCSLAEHAAEKAMQHQIWEALQDEWLKFLKSN